MDSGTTALESAQINAPSSVKSPIADEAAVDSPNTTSKEVVAETTSDTANIRCEDTDPSDLQASSCDTKTGSSKETDKSGDLSDLTVGANNGDAGTSICKKFDKVGGLSDSTGDAETDSSKETGKSEGLSDSTGDTKIGSLPSASVPPKADVKTDATALTPHNKCDGESLSNPEEVNTSKPDECESDQSHIGEMGIDNCNTSERSKIISVKIGQDTSSNAAVSTDDISSENKPSGNCDSQLNAENIEEDVINSYKVSSSLSMEHSHDSNETSKAVDSQSSSSKTAVNQDISESSNFTTASNNQQLSTSDVEGEENNVRLIELDDSHAESSTVDQTTVECSNVKFSDKTSSPSDAVEKILDDTLMEVDPFHHTKDPSEHMDVGKGSGLIIASVDAHQDSLAEASETEIKDVVSKSGSKENTNLALSEFPSGTSVSYENSSHKTDLEGNGCLGKESTKKSIDDRKSPTSQESKSDTNLGRTDETLPDSTSAGCLTTADDTMEVDKNSSISSEEDLVMAADSKEESSKPMHSPTSALAINEEPSSCPVENLDLGKSSSNPNNKTLPSENSTRDKQPNAVDGDEEVCIVPDTEPRVLTDEEKADAFEKANKPPPGSPKESSENKNVQENSTESMSTSRAEEEIKGKELNTSSSSGSKKPGIQLVSTSSLVSKPETLQKEKEKRDVNDRPSAQDDIQTEDSEDQACALCQKVTKCKYHLKSSGVYICENDCYAQYRKKNEAPAPKISNRPRKVDHAFVHKCGQCLKRVDVKSEKTLSWETMDFCSEDCLEKYQKVVGSKCANCNGSVPTVSLGKYCVRFGYDMKQFCCAACLEDFKKGLKVCSYCQKDISGATDGFLAPVGDKGQFKDFCTKECMAKYDQMSHNSAPPEISHECAVCNEVKAVKVEVLLDSKVQKFCSEPCFAAFKFVNSIVADQCDMCKKYYDHNRSENFTVFYDEAPHTFCCKTCMNVYILAKRKIVPCSCCKVKKYNFDMIKKTLSNGQVTLMLCSLQCLNMYQQTSVSLKKSCELCNSTSPIQYHLTMSDASVRGFCSPNCLANFQGRFSNTSNPVQGDKTPYPLGLPRKIGSKKISTVNVTIGEKELGSSNSTGSMPIISSVTSLAPAQGPHPQVTPTPAPVPVPLPSSSSVTLNKSSAPEPVKTVYKQQFIIRPPVQPEMANCAVQVKPKTQSKEVSCQPETSSIGTQTDESMMKPILIPVPVPIYIPTPMRMYSSPYPIPVPIALPIPVPIFIPTTRNSAKGILKEIIRIQEKIPSDPFEAELLMMAEMVAGEKKSENTDSDTDDEGNNEQIDDGKNTGKPDFSPKNVESLKGSGDNELQMALMKMASEINDPAVGLETAGVSSATSQTTCAETQPTGEDEDDSEEDTESEHSSRRRRKRPSTRLCSVNPKRKRRSSFSDQSSLLSTSESNLISKEEEVEKPDSNMCLKFTLGVNAWKSWVSQKNNEIEKGDNSKKMKLFKTELLQLTSDELNYSLCLFVKESRKPNGEEYTPDTIYYLCLGIQQYLIENGRVENIFTDPYYEKFTDCLDEVVKKFSLVVNDAQFLVTRIEEEHLWESKQLGAHSPYVLLNTLMYFNTKHFNLMTVDEHMELSFSHIMKHWKRPPNSTSGSIKAGMPRNIVLRFYPPQSALVNNSKKKKVYEQDENEDNPLRCPVKLYEFYLSKCPESVKTRNDVFYLLPERSCVPDSPVWYSTMALGKDHLQKILNRVKMVKEINML